MDPEKTDETQRQDDLTQRETAPTASIIAVPAVNHMHTGKESSSIVEENHEVAPVPDSAKDESEGNVGAVQESNVQKDSREQSKANIDHPLNASKIPKNEKAQLSLQEKSEQTLKDPGKDAKEIGIFKDRFAGIQSIFSSFQSVAIAASLAFTAYWSHKVLVATEQEHIARVTVDKLNNEVGKLQMEINKLQVELSRKK